MHHPKQYIARRRLAWLALAGLGMGGAIALTRRAPRDLRDQVVVITGSSRGLGLALAEEFAQQGARIALCGRDGRRLEEARQRISALGVATLAMPCDVTDQTQVEQMLATTIGEFGGIDILVNNVAPLRVGSVANSALQDFADTLDVAFWGTVYAALAVLPHMRERQRGQIVNITSLGGKISLPQMLAYSSAKFAAVGFSEGLRAELAQTGIRVTTVIPGWLRAATRDQAEQDVPAPTLALDIHRAARQIVAATRRGDAEVVLSWQAKLLLGFHSLFPGQTGAILALLNAILPRDDQTIANAPLNSASSDLRGQRSILTNME